MPCKNTFGRFFGSSNNTFSGSVCREDKYANVAQKPVCTFNVYPKKERHEIIVACCGVTELPFGLTSSTLYDAGIRHNPDNKTPAIWNVDTVTMFPTSGNSGYVLTDATATLVTDASAVLVDGNTVNVDSAVHVTVPRCAASGIIFDVNQLSTFATSIYKNQIKEARDVTMPGGGVPVAPFVASGFGDYTVGATAATFTSTDLGYDVLRLMHVPEVTFYNDSRHPVYIVDGFDGKTDDNANAAAGCAKKMCSATNTVNGRVQYKFEGVDTSISCKPREALTLVFYPNRGQWRVKDTNCRA